MIFFSFLGAASIWDLKTKRIPNLLIVAGLICAVGSSAFVSLEALGWSLGGAVLGAVLMLPFYNWNLMGGGDVKLAGLIGAIVGFPGVIVAIALGLWIGAIVIPTLLWSGVVKGGDKVPFAPILTLGAIGAYFLTERILDVYSGIFIPG